MCIYPWSNVPGGSFPWGNYVGDKSSERHSGAIYRGIMSGGNYLWDNFPEAIIQRAIIRGAFFLGRKFPRRQLSGGQLEKGCAVDLK